MSAARNITTDGTDGTERKVKERILYRVEYSWIEYPADPQSGVRLRRGHTAWWGESDAQACASFAQKFPSAQDVRVTACLLSNIVKTRLP